VESLKKPGAASLKVLKREITHKAFDERRDRAVKTTSAISALVPNFLSDVLYEFFARL
jgi:hypothetical protein